MSNSSSMKKVLITGGTGLVGRYLFTMLKDKGYDVAVLSRKRTYLLNMPTVYWSVRNKTIDVEAVNSANYIIHLAGANIASRNWTFFRKKNLYGSRVYSAMHILNNLDRENNNLKAFISASATGCYGYAEPDKIFSEDDAFGHDFLANLCEDWELVTSYFSVVGARTVSIRSGLVMARNGGVLPRIGRLVKFGLGAVLGTGEQFMPWIHIRDLCRIYVMAMENPQMMGAYNAVAPEHITNREFTYSIANCVNRRIRLPDIPAWLLKLRFGERSNIFLKGNRVSCDKICSTGFVFEHKTIDSALDDLCHKKNSLFF